MNGDRLEDVAREFVFEKIQQRIRKLQHDKVVSSPVGLGTESRLREVLGEIYESRGVFINEDKKIDMTLTLGSPDFIKAGLSGAKSYETLHKCWHQCDLVFRFKSEIFLYGEIKTTTSAPQNTCGLINKSISSLRLFGKPLLAIVLYPDKSCQGLKDDFNYYLDGLRASGLITNDEHSIATKNFFLLTNIRWAGDLQKRVKALNLKEYANSEFNSSDAERVIGELIKNEELLCESDLNYSEWQRLLSTIDQCLSSFST